MAAEVILLLTWLLSLFQNITHHCAPVAPPASAPPLAACSAVLFAAILSCRCCSARRMLSTTRAWADLAWWLAPLAAALALSAASNASLDVSGCESGGRLKVPGPSLPAVGE